MTGEKLCYAMSPITPSLRPMLPPYDGTDAWLGLMVGKGGVWAYVGFTKIPNIRQQTAGRHFVTRVRWDDELTRFRMSHDSGSRFIYFSVDVNAPNWTGNDAAERMYQSESVLLELNWYSQGLVHYQFSMDGAKDAIAAMYASCSDQ